MSFLCPCEAVDKIFPVVKVKTEVETGHFHVILPQIICLLQFAQIPDFGVQVLPCFRLTATA